MGEAAQRLKGELAQLSRADRAELLKFLLATLDPETRKRLELAWEAERVRRHQ